MILFNNFLILLTDLRPVIDPDSKVAFSLFGIPIAWYAVIILSGALIATIYGYYRFGKPLGLSSDTVFSGLVLGLLFGIIGARLYYVIFTASSGEIHYDSFMDVINPRNGGLAIHGGIIAAFDCRGSLYGEQRHDCFSLFSSYFPAQLFHHRRQLLSPQRKLHLSGRLADNLPNHHNNHLAEALLCRLPCRLHPRDKLRHTHHIRYIFLHLFG